ncbi:MAG: hypothetical protein V4541_03910 [Bacteroidota bacterium]
MIPSPVKSSFISFFALLLTVLTSCGGDDLKNATAISSKKIILTKDRSYGVEVVYSDSAIVKAKGFAPILDKVTPSQGAVYSEMPKGVKIQFFDAYLQITGSITSDYAINKETERITIFKKNVIVINDQMTFTTEELVWDENKKSYFSPYGTVTTKDGTVFNGTSFSAPQDFSSYKIVAASGSGFVKEDAMP